MGSPTLLHNFYFDQVDGDLHPKASNRITLHPVCFGGPEPPVPTARSITIARIASPSTINKTYQHLFLHSLKKYFEFRPRLVHYGDTITISLDTGEDQLVQQLNALVGGGIDFYESVIQKRDERFLKLV